MKKELIIIAFPQDGNKSILKPTECTSYPFTCKKVDKLYPGLSWKMVERPDGGGYMIVEADSHYPISKGETKEEANKAFFSRKYLGRPLGIADLKSLILGWKKISKMHLETQWV